MPKKVVKKVTTTTEENVESVGKKIKTSKKQSKKIDRKRTIKEVEKVLIENMVSLQKVHADLAEKFDKLTNEISTLLKLFEMAARSFSKSGPVKASVKDTEFLNKIDKLLEQNKTIAKGLSLMEEKVRQRMYGEEPIQDNSTHENHQEDQDQFGQSRSSSRPLPKF
jgi:hypothetical protein